MNKIKSILLLSLVAISSCRNENEINRESDNSVNLVNQLDKVVENTVSPDIFNIHSIKYLNGESGVYKYSIKAFDKVINNFKVNLDGVDLEVRIHNDEKIIKINNDQLGSNINIQYFFSKEKTIDLSNGRNVNEEYLNDSKNNTKYTIASVLLHYLLKNSLEGGDFDIKGIFNRSCSRTITSLRYTRSSAEDHVNAATNNFIASNPSCRRIHAVSVGCLWEDFGCVAVQEISCSGRVCEERSFEIL